MNRLPGKRRNRRTVLLACITVVLSTSLTLAAAEYLLRRHAAAIATSDRMDPGLIVFDDALGWRLQRDWQGAHRHAAYAVEYTTNGAGFRGTPPADDAAPRIAVLGDSFTFGLGVGAGDTFSDQLEQRMPRYRCLNFGVPGYSSDQQLLQLRSVLEQHAPTHVLWVVHLGNDLLDNRHPFPLQAAYAKPYFVLEDGRLALRNVPVPRVQKQGHHLHMTLGSEILGNARVKPRWRTLLAASQIGQLVDALLGADQDALLRHLEGSVKDDLDLFMAIVNEARRLLHARQVGLAVVLLSGAGHVEQPRSLAYTYQAYLLQQLSRRLEDRGIPVIDVASALLAQHPAQGRLYYPNEGHLTRQGHALVAERIAAELPRKLFTTARTARANPYPG